MVARGGAWRKLEARDYDAETSGGAYRRMGGPMKTKFHRKGDRGKKFLSDGVICGLIGEAEAEVAARQWSLMY